MIITAHGGALNTGRNTKLYFDTIADYSVDAIEVDIYSGRGGRLYISHMPMLPWRQKRALPLSFVFEYVKEQGFKVNCDVKQKGLVKPVLDLARSLGAEEHIYFTGSVSPAEIKDLTAGEAALNVVFFGGLVPSVKTAEKFKKVIDDCQNERVKALNLH